MIDKIKKFASFLKRDKTTRAPKELQDRPKMFRNLKLTTRRDRRIAMRRIIKRDGLKRPKYMSPIRLKQYWEDCRGLVAEEMANIRKGKSNG